MAVNATEVLYLTSGLFKAAPSKAILTDLVKFNGTIDGLAASLGTSPYAVNAFPFSNAEKAKTLAENLLGSTVADKAAAVTALEGILNANGGNVGIAAAAGIRAILSDAAFADAKAQLENRVKVAAAYVDSNKGNEISTSVLDSVTKDAATVTAALATLSGTTGGNEAGSTRVLTTAQDLFTGTSGDDFFRAVAGAQQGTQDQTTLNSSDIIDGAAGADTIVVNMTGANYVGGARIKNIETLQIGNNIGTATFDYNVNQGQNEITEVTKVVYDQINAGESQRVVNLLKTGDNIPTLAWTNEANSTAGNIQADFRTSAVDGTATVLNVQLNNVLNGALDIGAGIETLNINSGGTSTLGNILNNSNRDDNGAAQNVDILSAGSSATVLTEAGNDDGSLKKVVVTGDKTFGKLATVVTDTTNANFGLVNRTAGGADDLGRDTTSTAANLISLAATVTELDASAATADTNIRFTSRVDAAEVNVTYKGGKANDYVEFQQGNINATGGDGNDTFAFINAQNNSTLTTADTIVGGAGTDTIQVGVNGAGSYNLDTTEFNNKSGIDVLDLRGATNTVRLADAFVGAADAGLVVRTDKIVQTSDTNTANSSTATTNNALENNSTNTVTLTALAANRAIEFIGGSGSDRIVVNEVSLNSNVKLDGGTNLTTTGRFDTITVQDSAVLSRGDLAQVKNFEGIVLVKSDANSARQYTIEVTEAFLNNNSGQNKTLQIGTIAAANQNVLGAGDTVTIDVSDLLTAANTFKTTGYDRKLDTTSLTAAGVTVNYVANGGAVTAATLQALGLVNSTADASQALVLNSAATAVSNTGGVAAVALSATAAAITANTPANTGGAGTADTLTVTTAGTVTVGSQTTALENLILSSAGANTVTFAQAGFTNITGGSAADDVDMTNLVASASASLGDGNDTLRTSGTVTGTLAGGNGATDTLVLTNTSNISGATVSGFEVLDLGTTNTTRTMTIAQFQGFTSFANVTANTDIIAFSAAGSVTLNASVNAYNLANGTNTIDATAAAAWSITGGTGVDTISVGANLGATDTIAGGGGADVLILTGAGTGSNNITAIPTIQVNYATAATFTTGAITPGVASTITAAGSTAAVTLDASLYVPTTSLGITDGQGNDTITVSTTDANRALTTVSLATGGTDTVVINNAAVAAGDSHVTINNFVAGNGGDKIATQIAGATNSGAFAEITTAGTAVGLAANNGVIEINSALGQITAPTDTADAGAVESLVALAVGTNTNAGTFTVVAYGSGNAYLYQVTTTAAAADVTTANITQVEYIGLIGNVTANALDSGNFA